MTQQYVSFFSSPRLILPLRYRLSNLNVFRVVHGGAKNDFCRLAVLDFSRNAIRTLKCPSNTFRIVLCL